MLHWWKGLSVDGTPLAKCRDLTRIWFSLWEKPTGCLHPTPCTLHPTPYTLTPLVADSLAECRDLTKIVFSL